MSNQYEVLGKAPTLDDLKKLSPDEIHLTIKRFKCWLWKNGNSCIILICL